MKKITWFRQGRDLIKPFKIRDEANKTLLRRSSGLIIVSVLSISLLFLLGSRQIKLLINRDYLEKTESVFIQNFYPVYDKAYYWLFYQGNLAKNLENQSVEQVFSLILPALSQNSDLHEIQIGLAGSQNQIRYICSGGSWTQAESLLPGFSEWLESEDLHDNQIHWADASVHDPNTISLFWLHTTPEGQKYYVLISTPFLYQESFARNDIVDEFGAAVFMDTAGKNQIYPFGNLEKTESSVLPLSVAKKIQSLKTGTTVQEKWEFLSQNEFVDKGAGTDSSILYSAHSKNNFWLKIIPVKTQTEYNYLAILLHAKNPFLFYGLPINVLVVLGIVFLLINLSVFIFYYIKYARRFYFTNQISHIIKQGESSEMEFKSSLRYDYQTKQINKVLEQVILKTIAAFNNTEGGILIIGINDEGAALGLNNDYSTLKKGDKDGFELHIRSLVATAYGEHFASRSMEVWFPLLDDKELCLVQIKKGKKPIYTIAVDKNNVKTEKFYIRMGNSSREIEKPSDIIAYQSERFRRNINIKKLQGTI